jgi:hypothetical protein
MKTTALRVAGFLLALAVGGCDADPNPKAAAPKSTKPAAPAGREPAASWEGSTKKELGKGVWFETKGDRRRVLVDAEVCLREGQFGLECLLCRSRTKEHESILRTDAQAKVIHAGLLACGAETGAPVQYQPKFKPPSGHRVKVSVQYQEKGKTVTLPAQQWVVNAKTRKELEHDWVFCGSLFMPSFEDPKKTVYAADAEGAYICVSNVPTAMLDLPVDSPKGIEDRAYVMDTDRIPPLDAKVVVILEPVAEAKK